MKKSQSQNLPPKKFTVSDPIFGQEIHVFCNSTESAWYNWQKRLEISNPAGLDPNHVGFSTHISFDDRPNVYVIWLNQFNWTLNDQETLIHEITHTVVRIWQANNITFCPETQEFFAHSVGGLYSVIASKILATSKRKSRK